MTLNLGGRQAARGGVARCDAMREEDRRGVRSPEAAWAAAPANCFNPWQRCGARPWLLSGSLQPLINIPDIWQRFLYHCLIMGGIIAHSIIRPSTARPPTPTASAAATQPPNQQPTITPLPASQPGLGRSVE